MYINTHTAAQDWCRHVCVCVCMYRCGQRVMGEQSFHMMHIHIHTTTHRLVGGDVGGVNGGAGAADGWLGPRKEKGVV